MIYLLETALGVAKNFANNPESDEELAGAVEMGVFEVATDDGTGRAINIFLPARDTGADPAICQVTIESDGSVVSDSPFSEEEDAAMLLDQIEDAHARIAFCEEALHNMGYGQ